MVLDDEKAKETVYFLKSASWTECVFLFNFPLLNNKRQCGLLLLLRSKMYEVYSQ